MIRVPYTTLHPDTTTALNTHTPNWTGSRLNPDRPNDYHDWLTHTWDTSRRTRTDLAIVEHDIVIHASVVPGWAACPEPWCVNVYPGPASTLLVESLGCVRFTPLILRAVPDAPARAATADDSGDVPPRDWRRLDVRLATVLRAEGFTPHAHYPPVGHRHHYPPPNGPCSCGHCPGG